MNTGDYYLYSLSFIGEQKLLVDMFSEQKI